MSSRIEDFITVGPAVWPGKKLEVQPGDLSRFAPMGTGLTGCFPMTPMDDLSSVLSRPGYYSFHPHADHPFLDAPVTEADGGTLYFDGHPDRSQIEAMVRLMGVKTHLTSYSVFLGEASTPQQERFLVQIRIMTTYALQSVFKASIGEEGSSWVDQSLSIGELIWRFIQNQQERWGSGFSYELSGLMGGDNEWAKEALAFGFMVENSYWGIYRLWSRAWLVTK